MGILSGKNIQKKEKKKKKKYIDLIYHPFRKGWINILGDKHITINPTRKGKCSEPDADAYEQRVQESSLIELVRAYKEPIRYWSALTMEQKEAYNNDYGYYKRKYKKSIVGGLIIVTLTLVIVIAFLSWLTVRYTYLKMGI